MHGLVNPQYPLAKNRTVHNLLNTLKEHFCGLNTKIARLGFENTKHCRLVDQNASEIFISAKNNVYRVCLPMCKTKPNSVFSARFVLYYEYMPNSHD